MSTIGWVVGGVVAVACVAKFNRWRKDRQAGKAIDECVGALIFLLRPDDVLPVNRDGMVRCVRRGATLDLELLDFAKHWLSHPTDAAAIADCNRYLAELIRATGTMDEDQLEDELFAAIREVSPEAELVSDRDGVLVFEAEGCELEYQRDHLLIDLWGEPGARTRGRLMREWVERELDERAENAGPIANGFGRTRGTSARGDLVAPQRLH